MYSVSVLLLDPYRPQRLRMVLMQRRSLRALTFFASRTFRGSSKGQQVLAAANELVGPRTRRNTESQKTGPRVRVVKSGSHTCPTICRRVWRRPWCNTFVKGRLRVTHRRHVSESSVEGPERANSVSRIEKSLSHSLYRIS